MHISEIEYEDILKLRQQIMYPDKDIDFVKLGDDDQAIHIGVYEKGEPASVMSLFMSEKGVQFRKLCTLQEHQQKGFASALMQWLIDYANDIKINRLWCNARIEASDFYEKFGYKETSERFSQNGHEYVVMEKILER